MNLTVRLVNDGEIGISWLVPDHDGNSQINGYLIERREINPDDSETNWMVYDTVNQFTFDYKLTNLHVGGLYSIRVAATNAHYTGKYAEIREHIVAKFKYSVPNSPNRPLILSNMTGETVDVSWHEPTSSGSSRLLSYFIEKQDLSENIWIKVARVGPHVTSYKIVNLIEDRLYQVRVSAENEFGKSEPLTSTSFRSIRIFGN